MTGYGKAEALLPDKKLTIEVRALNSKQLDTNTRIPSLYKEKELEIRKLIASTLERGKVECSFFYELSTETSSASSWNSSTHRFWCSRFSECSRGR